MKESIVFVVNIGVVRHGTQNNSQLLNKAKLILKHIIQKKIFLRPNDEVGVILMGSDPSKNDDTIGLGNVQELCKMQVGNWDLIERIDKLQSTNQSSSWMEAIYVAIDYIKHECIDKSKCKILLLSDFNEDEDIVNQFQSKDIVKLLSSEEILLIAIGERALDDIDESSCTASETLLVNVLQKIEGQYRTFEQAISDVRFYRPSNKPSPWRCNLELGDFQIPIVGISQMLKRPDFPKMMPIAKTDNSSDEQVPIKTTTQYIDQNRTIYAKEDIIYGYVYGNKPISVTESAQKAMTSKTTEKCYRIHGFTEKENVPMTHWLSDGTYIIIPADESVSAPFYSLVRAMVKQNVVAIVEKVYRKNAENNMVALFPSVDDPNEPWCLVEICLPFERDYGAIAQRPLGSLMKQLSKEQSDAMDDLLTSLELPDDDVTVNSEKYLPGCMPDPGAQRLWDALSARALNPGKPLPPVADYLKDLLEQPECVREKCGPAAERIKNLFSLEEIKPKTRRYRTSKEKDNTKSDSQGSVSAIQTPKEKEKDAEKYSTSVSKNNPRVEVDDFDFNEISDI